MEVLIAKNNEEDTCQLISCHGVDCGHETLEDPEIVVNNLTQTDCNYWY